MSIDEILGLDIGATQIKAVKIEAGRRVRITALEAIDIGEDGIEPALGQLRERNLVCGVCVTSIHPGRLSLRNIPLPFRDERKIRQTIAFELEPLIPIPIEDAVIDFAVADDAKDAPAPVLAAIAPKAAVRDMVQLLERFVPEVSIIDVDALPLAAKLAGAGLREGALLIDVGAGKSVSFLLGGGAVRNIRSYDFGGDTLTRIIADASGLPWAQAEQEKINGDFLPARDGTDEACRGFAGEVEATLEMIRRSGQAAAPVKVMLTGAGALFPGIKKSFEEVLGVPSVFADLTGIDDYEIDSEIAAAWDLKFNNALALALRGMKKSAGLDFRRGEFELGKHALKLKRDLKWAALVMAASLSALVIDQALGYYLDYVKLKNLKSTINTVFQESCPDVTKIVDPVQQLKTKIAESRKISAGASGTTFLDLLKDISAAVPQSTGFLITSLSYDGEKIDMKAQTASFDTAEEVKKSLAASRRFANVNISSADMAKQGGKVEIGVRMDVRK